MLALQPSSPALTKPNTRSTHIDLLQQAILCSWLFNWYKERRPPIRNCAFAPRINPRNRDFIEKISLLSNHQDIPPFLWNSINPFCKELTNCRISTLNISPLIYTSGSCTDLERESSSDPPCSVLCLPSGCFSVSSLSWLTSLSLLYCAACT